MLRKNNAIVQLRIPNYHELPSRETSGSFQSCFDSVKEEVRITLPSSSINDIDDVTPSYSETRGNAKIRYLVFLPNQLTRKRFAWLTAIL